MTCPNCDEPHHVQGQSKAIVPIHHIGILRKSYINMFSIGIFDELSTHP